MKEKTILIITGPTATGKTSLGIECAKKFNGEIISADSMQIYKDLNIGTAKPDLEEQKSAKHHLIDFVDCNQEFSVQQFVEEADKIIERLFNEKKLPIIIGGTGLYIKSLIYPYSFCNAPKDINIRKKYEDILEQKGKEYLYSLLQKADLKSCEKIHLNDTKRVIRALEICEITGQKKTNLNIENEKPKYNYIMIVLNIEREELYNRINLRVDSMFEKGLKNEIYNLLEHNKINKDCQSMQAIGYKEFFIEGLDENEIKELIKKNSRNYAKRQITFMKSFKDAVWFNPLTQKQEIMKYIEESLRND